MFNHIIKGIKKYGRPLEQKRLLHLLEGNHDEDILIELLTFQNKDGGFGHGIEPDNFDIHSSPLQTWCAMNHLREIRFDKNNSMVLKMYDYLMHSFDQGKKRWPLYIESVMNYPHAPWWDYKETKDTYNPTASIIGFIIRYAPKTHPIYKLAEDLMEDALDYVSDLNQVMDMHDLRCFIEMIEDLSENNENEKIKYAKEQIMKRIDQTIEKDEKKWFHSYCAKPSYLMPKTNSLGVDIFKDYIHKELLMLKEQTNKEGLWEPTFTWNNTLSDYTWKSIIAIHYLNLLMKYKI
jgi:hypothetical protein